ncbi:MAG: sporulation transcriptional regulator SpoIIID [Aristaeellaceae bacterium]
MDEAIRQRVRAIAAYMVRNRATVRQAAGVFGISKSSVHKDMGERLPLVDPVLGRQVAALLSYNKAVRHLRGGEATRRRYRAEQAGH